jgi:hypothetical protein
VARAEGDNREESRSDVADRLQRLTRNMTFPDYFTKHGCAASFRLGKSELLLQCAVEQRLARQAHNLEVVGSIPTGAITLRD